MTERNTRRRSRVPTQARPLQPLISLTPRAVAIGLRLHLLHDCGNCCASLASHFDSRNRWIACKAKNGGRTC
jgi:hypothetical protein